MRPEHWLFTIPLRLRSLFRRRQVDQELEDELRDYVERKTEEYVGKGLAPEEARRQALLEMGGIEKRKEECRDARGTRLIEDTLADVKYAICCRFGTCRPAGSDSRDGLIGVGPFFQKLY